MYLYKKVVLDIIIASQSRLDNLESFKTVDLG